MVHLTSVASYQLITAGVYVPSLTSDHTCTCGFLNAINLPTYVQHSHITISRSNTSVWSSIKRFLLS